MPGSCSQACIQEEKKEGLMFDWIILENIVQYVTVSPRWNLSACMCAGTRGYSGVTHHPWQLEGT